MIDALFKATLSCPPSLNFGTRWACLKCHSVSPSPFSLSDTHTHVHAVTPEKVQTLTIKEGDRGYSYAVIFDKCLDGNVTWIEVEDPYIRARHQLHNFVRFCELVVRKCRKINRVHLTTTSSTQGETSGDVSIAREFC